jgi:hypothetical protein
MAKSFGRIPAALKHGGYSGITLLPGEDPQAFKKLQHDLIAEFEPIGRFEEDIVEQMARLLWRKQNLLTYRLVNEAKKRISVINYELVPQPPSPFSLLFSSDSVRAGREAANKQAREELGGLMELVELGDVVTTDHLLQELSVVDRLDNMIDRCLKRLLFVRGLKSVSTATAQSSSSTTPAAPAKRIVAA